MKFTILLIAWSGLLFWSGFVFGWRLRETTEKPAGGGIGGNNGSPMDAGNFVFRPHELDDADTERIPPSPHPPHRRIFSHAAMVQAEMAANAKLANQGMTQDGAGKEEEK
ncbi:MAG: hypothetical protein II894_01735 [Bacteroidales bacterium]|nr:hypothetical protein [Bacteroidales bacterium]